MNIIKLKDIIKPGDNLFNNHLKGKYAYWIQMRYIVSFDHMDYGGYIACEMDINKLLKKEDGTYPVPYGCPYIDTYMGEDCDIYPYIDETETDRINSIADLIIKNNFSPDADITVDELKKFRTWLATQLLLFDQNNFGQQLYVRYDKDTTMMLEYYKQGMIDNTIEVLTDMSMYKSVNNTTTDCCCCGADTMSNIFNIDSSTCDPILVYRKYIYNKMVVTFSDIEFWSQFPVEFIMDFKKYIDNILKMQFKLYKGTTCIDVEDCGGLSKNSSVQTQYEYILKKLSESLSYIINNDIPGHKNYISTALSEWSSLLYENMEW